MDNFAEQLVKRSETSADKTKRLILIIVGVFFTVVIAGLAVLQLTKPIFAMLGLILAAAAGYGTYFAVQGSYVEYEYTFTNGDLDFAQVFNNQKRKALGTMRVKNVEAFGPVDSNEFRKLINMPGINRKNWFLNRGAKLYYFYYQKENNRTIIVLEPSEELVGMIRKYLPPMAYRA